MQGQQPTKLSVAEYARIVGLNPLHVMGVQIPTVQIVSCDSAWRLYPWQSNQTAARALLVDAIYEAEAMIEAELGYRLMPAWEVGERVTLPRPRDPSIVGFSGLTPRGYRKMFQAKQGWWISGGVRAAEAIETGATIAWSSTKPPTAYKDTGTVTVTVAEGTDACQLRVYYPGKSGSEAWRIRPATATVSGTTATITFPREQCVIESIIENMNRKAEDGLPVIADGEDDADFLTEVDVYRVYNDYADQGQLLWDPTAICICNGAGTCPTCAMYGASTACFVAVDDPRDGIVSWARATWSDADQTWVPMTNLPWRDPDAVMVNYLAGYESPAVDCPRNQMDPYLAYTVAMLASSLLTISPCSCVQQSYKWWTADLALSQGSGETGQYSRYRTAPSTLELPWGTRRGAVDAWRRIHREGPTAKITRNVQLGV